MILAAVFSLLSANIGSEQPNLLLVILDDIANEFVDCYGEGPDEDQPPTPAMDCLAAKGMKFTRAYVNPVCSATRACLLTGRYSFRTGVGGATREKDGKDAQLGLGETTYPEVVPGTSFMIGKWHLGGKYWPFDPILHGFHAMAGTEGNIRDYFNHNVWTSWRYATRRGKADYSTRWIAENVVSFLKSDPPGPWTLTVSFHAVHRPIHWPPGDMHRYGDQQGGRPDSIAYQAMVQTMDSAIGWILDEVDLKTTLVIVIGDNGTSGRFSYPPDQGKKTMYEGGINVPLIVAGPQIAIGGQTTDSLVGGVDVYATMLDVTGQQSQAEDGISFLPVLQDAQVEIRDHVYCEYFGDDGSPDRRAVRGARYKITWDRAIDEILFFDLDNAPAGQDGAPIDPSQDQPAYDRLWALIQDPG